MSNAISYSRMSTHKKCGLKYRYAYIDKIKIDRGEPGPALVRGNMMHDSIENHIGKDEPLHEELVFWAQWLNSLKSAYTCLPESTWGITKDWEPCEFDSEDAFLRGIWDLKVLPVDDTLEIFEWKTGKVYDEHKDQRYLYAFAGLLHHPEVKNVRVTTVYLDQKKQEADMWSTENLMSMKGHYKAKVMLMGMDQTWIPNPNWTCRWCDFRKSNRGLCSFG